MGVNIHASSTECIALWVSTDQTFISTSWINNSNGETTWDTTKQINFNLQCKLHVMLYSFPCFKGNVMDNVLALSAQTPQSLSTACWEGSWTDQTLRIPGLCVTESQVIDVPAVKCSEIKGSPAHLIQQRQERVCRICPKETSYSPNLIGTLCKIPLAALMTSCCCQFEEVHISFSGFLPRVKPHHEHCNTACWEHRLMQR